MDVAIHHLSNVGPITAASGVLIYFGASYLRRVDLMKVGMWVCVIAECELAALKFIQMTA